MTFQQLRIPLNYSNTTSYIRLLSKFSSARLESIFTVPYATKNFNDDSVKVKVVQGDWWQEIIQCKPDALVLPTVRILEQHGYEILHQLARKLPLFLHEYGQPIKNVSAFDLYKERHELMTHIFTHGRKYQSQLVAKGFSVPSTITGASKSDLYRDLPLFERPTDKPYLVYCNSVSHVAMYNKSDSQPEKWVEILELSCRLAGYELVIKLHPHSYYQFRDASWRKKVYFNAYTADLFRGAAGIISDPSSLFIEGLLAEKPLFMPSLNVNEWSYLKNISQLIRILTEDTVQNSSIIKKTIEEFSLTKKYISAKNAYWHNADGMSSARIWQKILAVK
ncbi:MAG: hypothetical protein M3Q81_02595 [bacterium]|nr:hypothetical protein [bacterium]